MACVPMNIHAQEVVDSFEYTGQKIEIQNAMLYYTIEGELLDEAPIYCGTYIAWTSDEEAILFEINPKKVPIKVTYNKDWRENDPDKEKYLCDYVGNFEFKLRIDADGNINSLDNYQGNYDFQFEPKNAKDVEVLKTKVTHPDVEYVYSEDGIGEFIRKTSLDEFPQFFNVLKGDMSIVGTRPPLISETNLYEYQHFARLAIKPGITGMWQVSGRSEIIDFDEVVKLDKYYIENWNLGLDIEILFKTVLVVVCKKGAV